MHCSSPYLLAAIRMLESGMAAAEDIDNAMVLGSGHPLGPLRLSDLIGLDTITAIARSMHGELREPLYAPPPLLLADDGGQPARQEKRPRLLRLPCAAPQE